jgi:multicomponent Na+:H+ antiporter subunit E
LWGSISLANVLGGVLVGLVALTVGVGASGRGGVRLGPLLRFVWLVTVDLVVSTITVVREVLTPTDRTDEGIIAVAVPPGGKHHLLVLFVAITVTPGTAVVAAEPDGSVIYLHVLHCDRRDDVERHVRHLADLACAALPTAPTEPAEVS